MDASYMELFTQPILTLFLNKMPQLFSGRLLDVFLLEGEKVIFDIQLRMILLCRNKILNCTERTELFKFMTNEMIENEVSLYAS